MEDILPSRRQAVVDRLRRRIEFYRRHQEGCYPRYNQTSQGLYEQQRHETLTLKQRFLETKAKKVRKNDHKAAKDQNCVGNDRNLLVGSKLNKRTAEVLGSPVTSDGIPDDPRHPNKMARNSYPSDQGGSIQPTNNENKETQQPSSHALPSFSVQIVQQFSSVAHVQHSQTIQTNVTVKALNGAVNKTTDSPLATASSTISTDSPTQPGNGSISVGTNIECKQEKKMSGQCCNHSAPSDLPNLDTTSDATSRGERYSDTFSNFNFPDDSGDDVFHPDLLKDLIEDVFTNPSDLLMFEDSIGSVKDSVDDEKDSLASTIMDMSKLVGSPSNPQQFGATSLSQRSTGQSPHSASSLFDLGSTVNNNSSTPVVSSTSFPPSNNLSGLGLDFKLTEPSPAALTLKQMAEQHQNMQQKQQKQHPQQQSQQQNLNLGLTSPSSQNSFPSDNFSDPLTSIRSNFLNTTQSGLSQVVQKPAMYQSVGFSRQPGYQGSQVRPNNGMIFKQESFNANSPIDIELHKRQTIQQQMNDQKPPMGIGQVTYGSTRPLSHYTEPVGGQRQNQTFLRAQGPGITPPPTLQYGSSNVPRPRSAASSIHMSQTQQIQINQNTQHLQVSQEQQLRLDSSQTAVSANQQQSGIYVNYHQNPNSSAGFRMSQMQNVTFNAAQFAAAENANLRDHQSMGQNAPVKFVSQQRPPPPEYATHVGTGAALSVQQQQRVMTDNVRGIMIASQNQRVMQTADMGRRSMARTYQEPGQMTIRQGNMVPHFSQQDTSRPDVTKPIYTNALTKNQRPPNVSIGPDGLNVSQRSSCLPSDWRNNFIQSQQMGRTQGVRVQYIRPAAGQPTNYNSSLVGDITQNCDPPPPVRVAGTDTRLQRVPHPSVSSPVTHRMTSPRTYGGQMTTSPITMTTNQLYDAVQLPVSSSSSTVDNGHFDLTFLDTLDCSTSDLFSLEQAIQDSANSPFPLLEDMTLLGK